MRIFVTLVSAACLAGLICFAADPRPQKPVAGAGRLFVFSDDGATLSPTNAIYRKNVQVFESDMYLECDLLTLLLRGSRQEASTGTAGSTNLNAQLNSIIAEGNLLVMARGITILGDAAVYTRSNETVVVTGDPVIIERENLLMYATNCIYNRLSNDVSFIGPTETELTIQGGVAGTNAALPGFGSPRRSGTPASPKPGGNKQTP